MQLYYSPSENFLLILNKHPEVKFYVTGSNDNVDLKRLPASPYRALTGHVADISAAVAESWLSVVPLRKGSGTRFKILNYSAWGCREIPRAKGPKVWNCLW